MLIIPFHHESLEGRHEHNPVVVVHGFQMHQPSEMMERCLRAKTNERAAEPLSPPPALEFVGSLFSNTYGCSV